MADASRWIKPKVIKRLSFLRWNGNSNSMNIKGEFHMKKFTVFVVMAILIFILSSSSYAWTVYITNATDQKMTFQIKGEHLFWRQVDCEKTVLPQSQDTCSMPGAICPVEITAVHDHGSYIVPSTLAKCWDTKFLCYKYQSSFACQWSDGRYWFIWKKKITIDINMTDAPEQEHWTSQ